MSWRKVKLGDILERKKNLVEIKDDEEYKLVTVRLFHKGVTLRKVAKGNELSASKMHSVKTGEFILSGIDARHGAFGIVPAELEGAVVSNDFWCLSFDEEIIDKQFFLKLTSTTFFDDLCKKASDGTTNRVRLQADKFFNLEITLPPIEEQKDFVRRYSKTEETNCSISTELNHQLALVKGLRQAYLREAMQGKLISQNDADEPAEILLEKIKAEKEKLVAEKKIRKEKPLPEIKAEEIPFEIPSNWAWCRFGEICENRLGKMLDATKNKGEFLPYLRNLNVQWFRFELSSILEMKFEESELEEFSVKKGDLLICEGGEPGRAAIWESDDETFKFQKALHRARFYLDIDSKLYLYYLFLICNNKVISDYFTGSGIQHLTGKSLNLIPVPLPPVAEQKRIVEKLEKLMQFCDELEQNIKYGQKQTESLLQVSLKEALQG